MSLTNGERFGDHMRKGMLATICILLVIASYAYYHATKDETNEPPVITHIADQDTPTQVEIPSEEETVTIIEETAEEEEEIEEIQEIENPIFEEHNEEQENTTNESILQEENTTELTIKNTEHLLIVTVGDSLTAGKGLPKQDGYPAQLQEKIYAEGYNHTVIEKGIIGETTFGTKARFDTVLELEPDIVILTIGANDGFNFYKPEDIKANIEDMVVNMKEENITVILGGMQVLGEVDTTEYASDLIEMYQIPEEYAVYLNLGAQYVEDFKAIYPQIAIDHDLIFIPFFLEGVAANPYLNIDDGIHPNKAGYTYIVNENVWPQLEPLLI